MDFRTKLPSRGVVKRMVLDIRSRSISSSVIYVTRPVVQLRRTRRLMRPISYAFPVVSSLPKWPRSLMARKRLQGRPVRHHPEHFAPWSRTCSARPADRRQKKLGQNTGLAAQNVVFRVELVATRASVRCA